MVKLLEQVELEGQAEQEEQDELEGRVGER